MIFMMFVMNNSFCLVACLVFLVIPENMKGGEYSRKIRDFIKVSLKLRVRFGIWEWKVGADLKLYML